MSFESVFKKTTRAHRREAVRPRHREDPQNARNLDPFLSLDLVSSPDKTAHTQERHVTHLPLVDYVGARMFGGTLDEKIASGRAPEASRWLAARTQIIASISWRRQLAEHWIALLDGSKDPARPRDGGVPVVRDRIEGSRYQILILADALLAPLPTSRGVAMAHSLLCDGTGPIYNRGSSVDLDSKLRDVIAKLDPIAA